MAEAGILDVGARTVCVDCRGVATVIRVGVLRAGGVLAVVRAAWCPACGPERVWGFQADGGAKPGSQN